MYYVTSDLHGLPLSQLNDLLKKADFSDDDFLFILGDVVDRQNDGGVGILGWLLYQPNVQLILGNHEAMLLSCAFALDEVTDDSISELTHDKMALLYQYLSNGGDVTLKALRELKRTAPETVDDIFDYLRDAPLYDAVSVGGRDFLLCHSGLGGFSNEKKPSDYSPDELLWTRPSLEDSYYDGVTTVFGHTPTLFYGEEYRGKIIKTDTWIDIDVGVQCGNPPVLLRLDDMKEFFGE